MRMSSRMKLPCEGLLVAIESGIATLRTYHSKGSPRSAALHHTSSKLVAFSPLAGSHWNISCAKGRGTQHSDRLLTATLWNFLRSCHASVLSSLWLEKLSCEIGLPWRAGRRPAAGDIYGRDGARHVGGAMLL